jgi:hypothetical protein
MVLTCVLIKEAYPNNRARSTDNFPKWLGLDRLAKVAACLNAI